MEIESLRLDFHPIHIKEKPTQNISKKNPKKEEKKKKQNKRRRIQRRKKKKIRTKREEPRLEKREKESGESSQLISPVWPGLARRNKSQATQAALAQAARA